MVLSLGKKFHRHDDDNHNNAAFQYNKTIVLPSIINIIIIRLQELNFYHHQY